MSATYQSIAEGIAEQIRTGKLPPESKIPSEKDLQLRYGVSSSVSRAAIALLRSQGLIYSRQGKGSFVSPRWKPVPKSTHNGHPVEAADTQPGKVIAVDLSEGLPPEDVAQLLQLPPTAKVQKIEYRVEYRGGDVSHLIEITQHYELISPDAEIDPRDLHNPDPIARQARSGVDITQVHETISARMPTADEGHLMDIPPGKPVMEVQRIYYCHARVVAVSKSLLRSDRVVLNNIHDIAH